MKRLWMFAVSLIAVCFLSVSLAQDASAPILQGVSVPDSVWYLVAPFIGVAVKVLASPLTQLLKTRLGFTGNAAQLLYAVLSLLFVAVYGVVMGAFGVGPHGWLSALIAFGSALVKGYGDYSKLIQTSAAGAAAALPVVKAVPGAVLTPAGLINGASVTPPIVNGLEKL